MRWSTLAQNSKPRALAMALLLSAPRAAWAVDEAPPTVDGALEIANQQFIQGDFAGALDVLSPACTGSNRPECAFSLGAIYHALGRCSAAREHYLRYRALAPAGELLPEVEAALAEIEPHCGAPASPPPSAPAPSAPAPSRPAPPAAPSPPVPVRAAPSRAPHAAGSPAHPQPVEALPALDERHSNGPVIVTFLGLSGAAALTSVVFGVLAARSANRCDAHRVYDQRYVDECEERLPRYQGLWQGFAIASASTLALGGALWWIDVSADGQNGVAAGALPMLHYRRRF